MDQRVSWKLKSLNVSSPTNVDFSTPLPLPPELDAAALVGIGCACDGFLAGFFHADRTAWQRQVNQLWSLLLDERLPILYFATAAWTHPLASSIR